MDNHIAWYGFLTIWHLICLRVFKMKICFLIQGVAQIKLANDLCSLKISPKLHLSFVLKVYFSYFVLAIWQVY